MPPPLRNVDYFEKFSKSASGAFDHADQFHVRKTWGVWPAGDLPNVARHAGMRPWWGSHSKFNPAGKESR
jgi:hypothetical protein